MDLISGTWQSFAKNINSQIYLQSIDEHCLLLQQNLPASDGGVICSTITSSLQKLETRLFGLQLLKKYLGQFVTPIPDEKISLWTTSILKSCFRDKDFMPVLSYDTLAKLVELSANSVELQKSFGVNHIPKIYDALERTNSEPLAQLAALHLIEKCLISYPVQSFQAKGNIECFLNRFLDTSSEYIARYCGKCYNLLLQLRKGGLQGSANKEAWQSYQARLLDSLQELLNQLYEKCFNSQANEEFNASKSCLSSLDISVDPIERVAQLFIRFNNVVTYLIMALRDSLPAKKPVAFKKILNLIGRGFNVTLLSLREKHIIDNIALGLMLPKIHNALLNLLKEVLQILGHHSKIHHQFVLNIFVDILKASRPLQDSEILLTKLRGNAYDIIRIWCREMSSGSRCETIADFIVQEILNDATENVCALKVFNVLTKEKGRKKQKLEVDKYKSKQSGSSGFHLKKDFSEKQMLCISGLKCLYDILVSSSSYIKQTIIKAIEIKLVQISALFYEKPLENQLIFQNHNCRLEIYRVLHALLISPQYHGSLSTQTMYEILRTAHQRDSNINVRSQCESILSSLEKCIHPHKEGLLYSFERKTTKYFCDINDYYNQTDNDNETIGEIQIVSNEIVNVLSPQKSDSVVDASEDKAEKADYTNEHTRQELISNMNQKRKISAENSDEEMSCNEPITEINVTDSLEGGSGSHENDRFRSEAAENLTEQEKCLHGGNANTEALTAPTVERGSDTPIPKPQQKNLSQEDNANTDDLAEPIVERKSDPSIFIGDDEDLIAELEKSFIDELS